MILQWHAVVILGFLQISSLKFLDVLFSSDNGPALCQVGSTIYTIFVDNSNNFFHSQRRNFYSEVASLGGDTAMCAAGFAVNSPGGHVLKSHQGPSSACPCIASGHCEDSRTGAGTQYVPASSWPTDVASSFAFFFF